jgi:hypothetical protein
MYEGNSTEETSIESGLVKLTTLSYRNSEELLNVAGSPDATKTDILAGNAYRFFNQTHNLDLISKGRRVTFVAQNLGKLLQPADIKLEDVKNVTEPFAEVIDSSIAKGDLILHLSTYSFPDQNIWGTSLLNLINANSPTSDAVIRAVRNPNCLYCHLNFSNLLPTRLAVTKSIEGNAESKGTLAKAIERVFPFKLFLENTISLNITDPNSFNRQLLAMNSNYNKFSTLYDSIRTSFGSYTNMLPEMRLE